MSRGFFAVAFIAACSSSIDPAAQPDAEDAGADGATAQSGPGADGGGTDATDGLPDGGGGDAAGSDGGGGSDAGGDAGVDAGADAGPTVSYKHYDINHILSTGQSDAVATGAVPEITTAQPFGNMMFDVGVMTCAGCNGAGCTQYQTPTGFAPLVEGDRFYSGYKVETMSSGLANQASVFATSWFGAVGLPYTSHDVFVSQHGRSGNSYWCLRYGTSAGAGQNQYCGYHGAQYLPAFPEGIKQMQAAKAFADAAGKTYVVRAATFIHGASTHSAAGENEFFMTRNDGQLGPYGNGEVGDYGEALLELQRDYEAQAKIVTGQTEGVPLFLSQFGAWVDKPVSKVPVWQMQAHEKGQGKVIVVTPNYPFVHQTDCNHYTNHSQRRLGAYFAKAYQKTVIEGTPFEPLRPISITRAGSVLTVKFLVPVPPMVIDTTRVTNPGNYGFTYADSTSSASIASVALAGADTVTVTLSNAPTGANKKLRYALNAPAQDPCPGPTHGARGNLRDSDATTGYHTDPGGQPYELHNWAVHFELDVP